MPERKLVAKELAEIFKVISHPDRIRIIEELGTEEKDVNTLMSHLDLPGPRVSQHLALLRAHRFVDDRRDGRHHFYRLHQPEIADWIMNGLDFIEGRLSPVTKSTISSARERWSSQSGTS
jgi:DNA-binding transcriptional ArsR family regulator